MLEKIKHIKNPLTIIAIFAGIAELSGSVILPFIDENMQIIFVWFLMIFPTLLIILFFLTLNFNNKVLYAPSDYKDEDNFFRLFKQASSEERVLKLKQEFEEVQSDEESKIKETLKNELKEESDTNRLDKETIDNNSLPKKVVNIKDNHHLAEELLLLKLQDELKIEIQRDTSFNYGNRQFLFDGVAKKDRKVYVIEVKYIYGNKFNKQALTNTLNVLTNFYTYANKINNENKRELKIILAIVIDASQEKYTILQRRIRNISNNYIFPFDVKFYNYVDLLVEFEFNTN